MTKLNLDVDTPDKIAPILRLAAETYYELASEFVSTWRDQRAGAVWNHIAKILEHAADSIDRVNPCRAARH